MEIHRSPKQAGERERKERGGTSRGELSRIQLYGRLPEFMELFYAFLFILLAERRPVILQVLVLRADLVALIDLLLHTRRGVSFACSERNVST